MTPFILYLHGFLSAPQSAKAQLTLEYCRQLGLGDHIAIPYMSGSPAETIAQLETLIAGADGSLCLLGSSLGGYYATWLAEKYDAPAVLINPAVRPFELWQDHIGEHRNYYSEDVHVVTEDHIAEIRQLHCEELKHPENFMVLLQTGDETLDYRLAAEKFAASELLVRQGGNHSYVDYEAELPAIFDYLLSRIGCSVR